jgi:hypothetical protein
MKKFPSAYGLLFILASLESNHVSRVTSQQASGMKDVNFSRVCPSAVAYRRLIKTDSLEIDFEGEVRPLLDPVDVFHVDDGGTVIRMKC